MCDGKSALSSSRLIFAIFAFAAPFVRPIGGGGSLSPSPGGRAPKSRCCFVFFPPPLPLLSTATCALLLPRFYGWRGGRNWGGSNIGSPPPCAPPSSSRSTQKLSGTFWGRKNLSSVSAAPAFFDEGSTCRLEHSEAIAKLLR